MNAFGVDVRGLDADAFLAAARHLYPLAVVAWLVLLLRVRRAGFLLAGVVLANVWVWTEVNWPLQRLYALGGSEDRVSNVALCQVVAAGNNPLHTIQIGQLHFEPFWSALVALLSLGSPERVLVVYPFLPLVAVVAFALTLWLGLRAGPEGGCDAWERALIAGGATLLATAPLDFAGAHRVAWPLTFLLKPNHALGLVLIPLVLRAFVSIRTWRGRLAVGVFLHLLAWVFVVHMAYVSAGLVVFALWSTLARDARARGDWTDALTVIGVNLAVVSPYLVMLLLGYPIFHPGPRLAVPPWSAHLLEVTTRTGWVFPLAAWGTVVMSRRGRLGRVWAAQVVAAAILWIAYMGLGLINRAKEMDELYHWLRFLGGGMAALGAWDLLGRAWAWLGESHPRLREGTWAMPAARAALLALLALPATLPYWWDPMTMDPYFRPSLTPLPEPLQALGSFFRERTDPQSVVAGDRATVRWVSALSGRRVLFANRFPTPKRAAARLAAEKALINGSAEPDALRTMARPFHLRYLLATPKMLALHKQTLERLEARPELRLVHFSGDRRRDYIAVFELVGA